MTALRLDRNDFAACLRVLDCTGRRMPRRIRVSAASVHHRRQMSEITTSPPLALEPGRTALGRPWLDVVSTRRAEGLMNCGLGLFLRARSSSNRPQQRAGGSSSRCVWFSQRVLIRRVLGLGVLLVGRLGLVPASWVPPVRLPARFVFGGFGTRWWCGKGGEMRGRWER